MLFNSYGFLFLFLPATLIAFYPAVRFAPVAAVPILFGMSLVFYGYWNPRDLYVLLMSILLNLTVGKSLLHAAEQSDLKRRTILAVGIAMDLAILGYYKYSAFLLQTFAGLLGMHWQIARLPLPLGISFFTFTQIAFLVEVYRGHIRTFDTRNFVLFVSYFPHLIAGPIIRYQSVVPQFFAWRNRTIDWEGVAAGVTIFAIGLVKKVLLADSIAPYASMLFDATAPHTPPTMLEAWGGALSFTLQLYFDFSGYSDMAIGLSKMLGVNLPINFDSPYKAVNIIDFWRRWHMTLSAFLRDYLYIPLGGNRHGSTRRYINLMITMLLGGLWHGAAWTFVIWGGLHGVYLMVNHAWQALRRRLGADLQRSSVAGRTSARLLTFLCVVVGWVLFRSANFATAYTVLKGMSGVNGIVMPQSGAWSADEAWWIAALLSIAWLSPNTNQLVPVVRPRPMMPFFAPLTWRPGLMYGAASGLLLGAAIARFSSAQFLYFNF